MLLVLGMLQPKELCCALVMVIALYAGSAAVRLMCLLGVAICCLGCVQLLDEGQLLHHVFKS